MHENLPLYLQKLELKYFDTSCTEVYIPKIKQGWYKPQKNWILICASLNRYIKMTLYGIYTLIFVLVY